MISQKYGVIGMHLFCVSETPGFTAYCRNFAQLYGIDEETATGTPNSGLTYYLRNHDIIRDNVVNTFVQGEVMGKPSQSYTVKSYFRF